MLASSLRRPALPAWPLLLAAGLAVVMAAAVVPFPHAAEKHGDDAVAVRQCVNRGSTVQYRDRRDPGKFYLLCQLPDGRWGLQIVARAGKVLEEITSFVRGEGTWDEVSGYVLRFATKFNGPLL
jgi:putative hemolysin